MNPYDIALLILRLWLAFVMIAHGVNHARSIDGTASWFSSKGFRSARLQAQASALGEVAIGAGLVLGFFTSFVAAGLVATMTVAFWSIHRFAGFFVFKRPDEGYEYVASLAVAATVLSVLGPGELSLDHVFGLASNLDGWVGLLIALAGVLAGAGQLALFWSLPDAEAKDGE